MQKRDIQLVEELVKLGADINARDYSGKACLHMALLNNIAVVAKLIDLGANVNTADGQGRTLLHLAASSSNNECLELLLERGASVRATDIKGSTPLHLAASSSNYEGIKLLLQKGANVEAADEQGKIPLHLAACYSNYECIELLLDKGACAQVNSQDFGYNIPFFYTSQLSKKFTANAEYYKTMKKFFLYGAELNLHEEECVDFFKLAYNKNDEEIVNQWLNKKFMSI
uniref:Ankyrin repeat protein n=1 Tax=Ditylenchus dipsaci TaxID=166011 RepID=A0A915E1P2_9BILA